jgi:branched-chain amino acid transport system substrate-binding protein
MIGELRKMTRKTFVLAVACAVFAVSATAGQADKNYGPGVSDTEIKIGNLSPYSGPASAYSIIARTEAAYFAKINAEGGINGRKIVFVSYDDAYSPPKAVEQVRRLVESDEVLLVFQPLGTPTNAAIQRYMNDKKVPQLFVSSGSSKFTDPEHFPWTMGFNPTLTDEATVYGRYILANHPTGRIAVLYQNDDYGREMLEGLKKGLGNKASTMLVATAHYETNDPTIDSQIVTLKSSGADIFVNLSTNKAAAQAIRKIGELNWKVLQIVASPANSAGAVMKPAGPENARGVLSVSYIKDPTDLTWKDDPAMKTWSNFMDAYYPGGDKMSLFAAYGYAAAETLVQVLKQCGDDLSRENVMRQAMSLKDFAPGMLLPETRINTSPTSYSVISQMQMMRFNGEQWELFGSVMTGRE